MSKILKVGIGGAGAYLAKNIQLSTAQDTLIINTTANKIEEPTIMFFPIAEEIKTLSQGRKAVRHFAQVLSKQMADYQTIVFMVGLGGITGTSVLQEIVDLSLAKNSRLYAVLTLPFGFEEQRRLIAERALEALSHTEMTLILHDHYLQAKDKKMSMSDYLAASAVSMQARINTAIRNAASTSDLALD